MSNFNIGFLRAVKSSIQEALANAEQKTLGLAEGRSQVTAFEAEKDIHKALGAFRMIGLEGIAKVCEEMELLCKEIKEGGADAKAGAEALKDSLGALKRYLEDLLDGAPDLPARVFSQYRKIREARGEENTSESALFYPDFDVPLAEERAFPGVPAAELDRAVKEARPKFQGALVKWMKDPSNMSVAQDVAVQMQAALRVLESLGHKKVYHLFWKAAGAFVELLKLPQDGAASSAELRGLISKIDIEMRKFAEGMKRPADDAFRGLLYHIAACKTQGNAKVDEVRLLFGLDKYWAEVQKGLLSSQEAPVEVDQDEIKELLGAAKEELPKVAAGGGSPPKLHQICVNLASKIAGFNNPAVKKLSDAIVFVAQKVANKELSLTDIVAEEVAFIFVLLEGLVDKRGRTNEEFDKQVDHEIKRLSAALKNQIDVLDQMGMPELDAQTKKENERALVRHTIGEIKTDLQQVEEVLDAFFRSDGSDKSEFKNISQPIRRSLGALKILNLLASARVLEKVGEIIGKIAESSAPPTDAEKAQLTEGVGCVSLYLDAYQDEGDNAARILDSALEMLFGEKPRSDEQQAQDAKNARESASAVSAVEEKIEPESKKQDADASVLSLEIPALAPVSQPSASLALDFSSRASETQKLQTPVAAQIAAATATAAAAAAAAVAQEASIWPCWDEASDAELAEVYLEEAGEILDSLQQQIVICETKPHDVEALKTIRRGFHTLKGSGRTVGLKGMGEAAWQVEVFMNKWMAEEKPAGKELLDMIGEAVVFFRGWTDELKAKQKVLVDGEPLKRIVEAVGGEKKSAHQAPRPATQESSQPSTLPGGEKAIQLGDKQISAALFDIFCRESEDRVKDLRKDVDILLENSGGEVRESTMRAAHTLGSIGRTVGLLEIAELGSALENWVAAQMEAKQQLESKDAKKLATIVSKLQSMVIAVQQQQLPSSGHEEVSMLNAWSQELREMREEETRKTQADAAEARRNAEESARQAQADAVEARRQAEEGARAAQEQAAEARRQTEEARRQAEEEMRSAQEETKRIQEAAGAARAGREAARKAQEEAIANEGREEQRAPMSSEAQGESGDHSERSAELSVGAEDSIASTLKNAAKEVGAIREHMARLEKILSSLALNAESFDLSKKKWIDLVNSNIEVRQSLRAIGTHLHLLGVAVGLGLDETVQGSNSEQAAQALALAQEAKSNGNSIEPVSPVAPTEQAEQAAEQIEQSPAPEAWAAAEAPVAEAQDIPEPEETEEIITIAVTETSEESKDDATEASLQPEEIEGAGAASAAGRELLVEENQDATAGETNHEMGSESAQAPQDEPVADVAEPVAEVAEPVAEVAEPVAEVAEPVASSDNSFEAMLGDLSALPVSQPQQQEPQNAQSQKDKLHELEEAREHDQEGEAEDSLDESLLPIFAEEAQELMPKISQHIRELRAAPDNKSVLGELHRELHTLKGSARMVGAFRVGNVTHYLESLMEEASIGKISAVDALGVLEAEFDKAINLVEEIFNPDIAKKNAEAAKARAAAEGNGDGQSAAETALEEKKEALAVAVDLMGDRGQAGTGKAVRVSTDIIDRMVNEAGEVRLSGAALTGTNVSLKKALSDLAENTKRLAKMLRELEIQTESQMVTRRAELQKDGDNFDPLEFDRFTRAQELSRFLAEGMHDIVDLQVSLEKVANEQESVLIHQDRMASDIQQTLMNVRLVQFDSISERLYRVVRQAARDVGKKVALDLIGEKSEIDRGVLDRMVAPLEHLLRNSVAHGIETPEERVAAGKPESGRILIEVENQGNYVSLKIKDDGAGINVEKVRQKGIEKGFIRVEDKTSDERIVDLIFLAGFSTAEAVSQVAGRGVGMDVVKNEIVSLGGQIELKNSQGHGLESIIALPVSLATTQAVLIESDSQLWAIPADMIDEIRTIRQEVMPNLYAAGTLRFQNKEYPMYYLPNLLGADIGNPEIKTHNSLVLASAGGKQVAIHVDRLLGTREVVVKNIGRQMARISGISGATVLGDGRTGVIINPVYLANRKQKAKFAQAALAETSQAVVEIHEEVMQTTVMVVDDSLTIRKATSKLLTREGYVVMLAKDGEDALEQLQERLPDVMLVDVEMPRMDGFELTKNVRASQKFKHIPIIMITSRTADKHKNTGLALGVNVYMGKPYKEDELLSHITIFVEEKKKGRKKETNA